MEKSDPALCKTIRNLCRSTIQQHPGSVQLLDDAAMLVYLIGRDSTIYEVQDGREGSTITVVHGRLGKVVATSEDMFYSDHVPDVEAFLEAVRSADLWRGSPAPESWSTQR